MKNSWFQHSLSARTPILDKKWFQRREWRTTRWLWLSANERFSWDQSGCRWLHTRVELVNQSELRLFCPSARRSSWIDNYELTLELTSYTPAEACPSSCIWVPFFERENLLVRSLQIDYRSYSANWISFEITHKEFASTRRWGDPSTLRSVIEARRMILPTGCGETFYSLSNIHKIGTTGTIEIPFAMKILSYSLRFS